ncbi:hypothetical protein D5S17_22895 [Pseudonocardiaceae bacterium YIM PH 21723]|nr:hypothetical protein D5S17_22895 [Pseudonocardiaceae bacterium YIM PH 21723]
MRTPLSLSWKPERADYLAALAARRRNRPSVVAGPWAAVVLAVALLIGTWDTELLVVRGLAVLAVLVAAGYLISVYRLGALVWRNNAELHEPTSAEVNPQDGLLLEFATHAGIEIHWQWLHHVYEFDGGFLLELHGAAGHQFLVLATRGLPEGAGIEDLRALLRHCHLESRVVPAG